VGTPFVAIPGHIEYWFWFNLFFLPLGMILNASAAGIMPDVCDIDELEYGERREGLFTAVQAFVNKMEISVMTLLTGVFLVWTGFSADYGNIQPPAVLQRMRWMAFTPLIFIAAVSFVVSCFMPITEAMMLRVRAQLDARHAAEHVPGVEPEGADSVPAV
jgi:Na+/melibiose symporter-like transporter